MTLVIPHAVRWEPVGSRTKVSYDVEFTTGGHPFGGTVLRHSKGSCWDDELDVCAAQVLKDALLAADRVRK